MSDYRVYFFEGEQDDSRRSNLNCASDAEACFAAWALLKPGNHVEIWQKVRCVAKLSAHSASARVPWPSDPLPFAA